MRKRLREPITCSTKRRALADVLWPTCSGRRALADVLWPTCSGQAPIVIFLRRGQRLTLRVLIGKSGVGVLLLKALKTRIQQRFGFCLQPDPGLPQQRTIMAAPLRRDMHAHALVRLLVD